MASYKTITQLVDTYNSTRASLAPNRQLQERDRGYYDGYQIDKAQRNELKSRGQRPIVFNVIQLSVNGITGIVQANNTDPRAYPRTPEAENASDVVTKVLRYIASTTEYDDIKLDLSKDLAIEGIAAVFTSAKRIVNRRKGTETTQVYAERIRPDEFFYDPYSRRFDFKDASYLGWAKWWDVKDVQDMYPEVANIGEGGLAGDLGSSLFGEQNSNNIWVTPDRKRVVVVEMYYISKDEFGEETWIRTVFTQNAILSEEVSPYQDDAGYPICPISAVSLGIDQENNRYGIVRGMIDAQDEINSRRSRALFMANNNRAYKNDPNAASVDRTIVSNEASKANGVLPDGYALISNADMMQGQMALYQDAFSFANRYAPSPAVLGRVSESLSGRAKLVDQQAGLTELGEFLDRLNTLEKNVYKKFWFAAQQWMTEEQTIVLTGDPRMIEHLTINRVVGYQLAINPETGQPEEQPIIENDLMEMDVDIIIETAPGNTTLQGETFEVIAKLLQSGVPLDGPVFKLLLEFIDMPNKERVEAIINQQTDEAAQAAAAQQEEQARQSKLMEESQIQKHNGEMAFKESQIRKNNADALKAVAEAEQKVVNTEQVQFTTGLVPYNRFN